MVRDNLKRHVLLSVWTSAEMRHLWLDAPAISASKTIFFAPKTTISRS